MALNNQIKSFKDKGRDIKYLNKDFVDFRTNLIEFAKTYFPTTYNDFNELTSRAPKERSRTSLVGFFL